MNTTMNRNDIPAEVSAMKVAMGCQLCGYNRSAAALHFDHINPATKYRTRKGDLVHLADMVKGGRYAWSTIVAEIAKCRVLCANCHMEYTHDVQRKV